MLNICENYLKTEELQSGFKKQVGCTNAVFVMIEATKYYLSNGSSIFAAALDLKKSIQ